VWKHDSVSDEKMGKSVHQVARHTKIYIRYDSLILQYLGTIRSQKCLISQLYNFCFSVDTCYISLHLILPLIVLRILEH
jgi:hypothetical protein